MSHIPKRLRGRLRNLIGNDMRQLVSDYDIDPSLLDQDPEYTDGLNALIDEVVTSVRMFDTPTQMEDLK